MKASAVVVALCALLGVLSSVCAQEAELLSSGYKHGSKYDGDHYDYHPKGDYYTGDSYKYGGDKYGDKPEYNHYDKYGKGYDKYPQYEKYGKPEYKGDYFKAKGGDHYDHHPKGEYKGDYHHGHTHYKGYKGYPPEEDYHRDGYYGDSHPPMDGYGVEVHYCNCPLGATNCGLCPIGYIPAGAASPYGSSPYGPSPYGKPCTQCPAGSTTSKAGSTTCDVCLPGYAGASCAPCKPDEYSTGGPAATTTCQACAVGYTTNGVRGTSSADCIPDTCTGRELTPVDLPADGYVTITQVPKCLDMLGGEFNDDCFELDVGPDYNGTLIHFYIPPAPTNRTLYASTCGMVNDGYWTQYTADTMIQVQYITPEDTSCPFIPLENDEGDPYCNDDFDDDDYSTVPYSESALMVCETDDNYLSQVPFPAPANTPMVVTVAMHDEFPDDLNCALAEPKAPFTVTFLDITNGVPQQPPLPTDLSIGQTGAGAAQRSLAKKGRNARKPGKGVGAHKSPRHHAEAEVEVVTASYNRPDAPAYDCDCPAGVGCGPCPAGTFAATGWGTACLPCPTGSTSSKAGATTCDVCEAGYAGVGCAECPAGTWSAGGPAATTTCTPCDDGFSSPAGSVSADACVVAACSARGVPASYVVPTDGTSVEVYQPGKCTWLTVDDIISYSCVDQSDPEPTFQPLIQFMIEPSATDRTLAVTNCHMTLDPMNYDNVPDMVVYAYAVSDEATCTLDYLDCVDSPDANLLPYDCDSSLGYMEVDVPADTRVLVRSMSFYELPCSNTWDRLPISLEVFDVTARRQGAQKAPRPTAADRLKRKEEKKKQKEEQQNKKAKKGKDKKGKNKKGQAQPAPVV